MHQTIFEYLCIFVHYTLFVWSYNVKKSFVCLGTNISFCSNINSCWERNTVWLGKTNSEILQSTHLHNANIFANLSNGQNQVPDWDQIKYSPVNLSKRSTFPIWWGLVEWHHQHFFSLFVSSDCTSRIQTTLMFVGLVITVTWFLLVNLTKLIFHIFNRAARTSFKLGYWISEINQ